ncbi:MAG: hypothetical protein WD011_05280, partial [Nitriliruptoraceae bacterium]
MIRFVVYNVTGGMDPDAVARVLGDIAPDVVSVIGAPTPRSVRALRRATEYGVAVRGGRGDGATALFVRPDVLVRSVERIALTADRKVSWRVASHAIVSSGGVNVSVLAVAFGLRPESRAADFDRLRQAVSGVEPPSVLGVALNESITSTVGARFTEAYQDAFAIAGVGVGDTYPSVDPIARRDV